MSNPSRAGDSSSPTADPPAYAPSTGHSPPLGFDSAGGDPRAGSPVSTVQDPPTTFGSILLRLGPGLIIAGSIVGSGELIATTSTGAEAGFVLLWLIIIGCVIKVFAQVEFGRFTIVTGRTTMDGMNEVPGPRLGPANWLVWYWLVMFLVALGQLGGIVGGVGQAVAMAAPISGDFNQLLDRQAAYAASAENIRSGKIQELDLQDPPPTQQQQQALDQAVLNQLGPAPREMALVELLIERSSGAPPPEQTKLDERPSAVVTIDDKLWATLITLVTMVLLVRGRYGMIQSVSTVLVAGFTLITVVNLLALQTTELAISSEQFWSGLTFSLPESSGPISPLATALMTLGIIGVGATELIQYPYWCLEKGYARFTGPRDQSEQWGKRARGWVRVMQVDAWLSMVIYTFATVAFYLLGASILHRFGLNPAGNQLIRDLSAMYDTFFGSWVRPVFLLGVFAVLYSTFFVANASHARVAADALRVFRVGALSNQAQLWWVRLFCGLFPALCLAVFVLYPKPKILVLASGLMQALMLPMLAAAALYFRFRRCDSRLSPGRSWDAFLWLSAAGLLAAGGSLFVIKITQALN